MCLVAQIKLDGYQEIIPGTSLSVDDVVSLGLFRYNSVKGTLQCPFIWIYMMARNTDHAILRRMLAIGKEKTPYTFHAQVLPGGRIWWQDWELFAASYRALLSEALATLPPSTASYTALHGGMLWGTGADEKIKVTKLILHQSSEQVDTKDIPTIIPCEDTNLDMTKCDSIVLNDASANSGDAFCCLRLENGATLREIHQFKLVSEPILTSAVMNNERTNAANPEDIFLIYSTFADVDLHSIPPRTGVVVKRNFLEYFGPFASRAVFLSQQTRPNANKSTQSELVLVHGIGVTNANQIIEARKSGNFSNIDDLHHRTNIPKELLSCFLF